MGRRVLVAGRLDALGEVSALLRQAGYRVDVSYEVAGALEMLRRGAYQAVLCDLSMSGGGGLRVLAALREWESDTPVVLITRHGERPDLIAALRSGAFDYLEEPFDPHDVSLAVGRAAAHHQLLARQRADDERLRRLEAVLRRLSAAPDLASLLGVIGSELPALLGVERFALYRYDDDRLALALSTHLDPASTRSVYIAREAGPLREAVLRGRPVVVPRQSAQEPTQVAVPMFVEDQLVGVALLEKRFGPGDGFDENELGFCEQVGSHVGSALRVRERTAALEAALRDLRAAQDELIRAERIAAVGKLASGIAHELKNPLTSMTFGVQNLRDLVARPGAPQEALETSLDTLADDIRRMRDRVQTFLSVARPQEGATQLVRVDEVLRRVVARYRDDPRASGLSVREEYGGSPVVRVDEDQLFAAASNLLLNAIESLSAVPVFEGAEIVVSVAAAEQRVRIAIADNGPGVPPGVRERIFDVFYTTKTSGTGLGLSQVSVFAERAGGRAWLAESAPGARFVIDLPEAHE
ncbi:MAG TPA: ATP-binding protein [Polyangia bacterium]|nr:ATP-binding protein [Polyangia bacterium]